MAARAPTVDLTPGNYDTTVTWTGLLNGDTGAPVSMPGRHLVSLQVLGTLGAGGQVTLQANNEAAPTVWASVGAVLSTLGITFFQAWTSARNFQPAITAGDGTTNLTVIALFQRGS